METKKTDWAFIIGLVAIQVALIMLYYTSKLSDLASDGGGAIVNYGIAFFYQLFVWVKFKGIFPFKKTPIRYYSVSLILAGISCFTLNYSIQVFSILETWAALYLVAYYISLLGLSFFNEISRGLRITLAFLFGFGCLLIVYYVMALMPLFPLGLLGAPFLGVSVHLLIPLLTLILSIVIFNKYLKKHVYTKISFLAGMVVPILVVCGFLVQWSKVQDSVYKASASVVTRPMNTLPEWVLLCQDIPMNSFAQKIVMGKIGYDVFESSWRRLGGGSFSETKRHDPLVNIGLFFLDGIDLNTDDRIRVLKSQYNARHKAQRKLWSGKDLKTIEVLNNVRIYPDYRLAYTEKIIKVKSKARWRDQEAAYTFYLPEGSVASSLSLWINGKEEKSRLTTKQKADSAYTRIVGVERRDPALMHWQEGNTLTVTVFPCPAKQNRKFKIGITSPLRKVGNQLKLENIYFEGPEGERIRETSQVEFVSDHNVEDVELPSGFEANLNRTSVYEGSFNPYWEVACSATPLSSKPFSFQGYIYKVKELVKEHAPMKCKAMYLDLNKSWSESEYNALFENFPEMEFYAFHDELIRIDGQNRELVFETLSRRNFSLFPFHAIKNMEESIVVTRSSELSPNIDDLGDCEFIERLTKGINETSKRIAVYQLGTVTSPYLKSLKEYQLFNFAQGDLEQLKQLITAGEYVFTKEDLNQVDIDIAQISLLRSKGDVTAQAPDHILRLFAYSRIMKELGRRNFNNAEDYYADLVPIANEAYIVSPVSSLVVLESEKDYDRFGIEKNKNSLKNASMKSSGAVPEPSEWALIILFAALLALLFYKKYMGKTVS